MTSSTTWPDVARRLAGERTYWLCTVGPDGSPHTSPVWGVVVVGDGEDVLIVRGRLRDAGTPARHGGVVAAIEGGLMGAGPCCPAGRGARRAALRVGVVGELREPRGPGS